MKNIYGYFPKSMLSNFEGCTILLTGATGLIGKAIVNTILSYNEATLKKIKLVLIVRNIEKAIALFGKPTEVEYAVGDVKDIEMGNIAVDYIIHGASQTSSYGFINYPVETIRTALEGTRNMLELAVRCKVRGFVYLSSMEIYGAPQTDVKISENFSSNINSMAVRSCYPESKRMCESLCAAYASEAGVPTKVIRLTQTFGEGVDYNDGRVFAEFARCAIEGKDIILHTKGETKRSYLYVLDAVSAVLTVLVKGGISEAYNAANETTYCSILEMANLVATHCADNTIRVCINETNREFGYAPVLRMNLDTTKLKKLGWNAQTDLIDIYKRMISYMKAVREKQ